MILGGRVRHRVHDPSTAPILTGPIAWGGSWGEGQPLHHGETLHRIASGMTDLQDPMVKFVIRP